jgi:hypothetical protein
MVVPLRMHNSQRERELSLEATIHIVAKPSVSALMR